MRLPSLFWPTGCTRHERIALQHRLSGLGYKVADFEGHLDFELRDAKSASAWCPTGIQAVPFWIRPASRRRADVEPSTARALAAQSMQVSIKISNLHELAPDP